MATDTMNHYYPGITGPHAQEHRSTGYAGQVVDIKSADFIISLVKFVGWAVFAAGVPTVLALVGLGILNWMNFQPSFYTGESYHGIQLFGLLVATVGYFAVWAVATGFTLFWSFLGMASAFQEPERPME